MTRVVFEYALLRVVPSLERGEQLNIGVLIYCHSHDVLEVALHLEPERLRVLAPQLDIEALESAAEALGRGCAGEGPASELSLGQRFRWLTAPRSTILQAGPVHSGLTEDPRAEAQRLLDVLVRQEPARPGR